MTNLPNTCPGCTRNVKAIEVRVPDKPIEANTLEAGGMLRTLYGFTYIPVISREEYEIEKLLETKDMRGV